MPPLPKLLLAASACAAAMLAAGAEASVSPPLPQISRVAFSAAGDGTYTATISGANFGTAPAGIPCTACAPPQLALADLVNPNTPETLNVTAWANKKITITGVAANPGDAVRVAVWSTAASNAAAWGGVVPGATTRLPHISSVTASGSGATLTVTVTGTGFGKAPAGLLGQTTNSAIFVATDYNAAAYTSGTGTSGGYPWNAGFCAANECDGVTLGYVSWTPKQIVVSGFGGSYGDGPWVSSPGDAFCVGVWPSTSTSGGTTGANVKCIRLPQ